jgi:hypothetical protein
MTKLELELENSRQHVSPLCIYFCPHTIREIADDENVVYS